MLQAEDGGVKHVALCYEGLASRAVQFVQQGVDRLSVTLGDQNPIRQQ